MTHAIQNHKTGKWLSPSGEWVDDRSSAHEHESHVAALDHWNVHHHTVIMIVPTPEDAP